MFVKTQIVNSSNQVYIEIKRAPYAQFLLINSPELKAQLRFFLLKKFRC